MRVLAVILARGGSTRVPGKNLRDLGDGVPMVVLARRAAADAQLVTHVCISTQDEEIARAADMLDAWVQRPEDLSGPNATIEQAMAHAIMTMENREREAGVERPEFDYVVALQAAVPVRPAGAIDALIRAVHEQQAQGGVTVVRRSPWIWRVHRTEGSAEDIAETWWHPRFYPRSQDVFHETLEEINSIQVAPRRVALCHRRHEFPMVLMEVPQWASIDIDTEEDLESARVVWPSVAERMTRPCAYRIHKVCHDWSPPSRRFPLQIRWANHLTGIVIGNGPQIDELPPTFWRTLMEDVNIVTIGLNRICCADVCTRAGFAPTMHLIWDRFAEEARPHINAGLRRLQGRTWRMCSPDSAPLFDHDQVLAPSPDAHGPPSELYMRHGSADGAANLLYRLGCRKIGFIGVEMLDGRRCKVPWTDHPGSTGSDAWRLSQLDALRDIVAYPQVELFSMCRESLLVSSGVMPYSLPPQFELTRSSAIAAN